MKETYKIKDLEHMRLLTDPLKLQLIQAFAEKAKTTKQVATELGESVTKLYRHVDALHDAGLLVVVEEKQKRGTIERTFRAVAERFEADQSLFADGAGGGAPMRFVTCCVAPRMRFSTWSRMPTTTMSKRRSLCGSGLRPHPSA